MQDQFPFLDLRFRNFPREHAPAPLNRCTMYILQEMKTCGIQSQILPWIFDLVIVIYPFKWTNMLIKFFPITSILHLLKLSAGKEFWNVLTYAQFVADADNPEQKQFVQNTTSHLLQPTFVCLEQTLINPHRRCIP